ASAPASASPVKSGGATVSGLTASQTTAKAKALRACARKRPARRARACRAQVNLRYRRLADKPPVGDTYNVNVGDDYYAPNVVELKVNDAINWSWADVAGFEAHNVTLLDGPAGVSRSDFASQTTTATSYRFKRAFSQPGLYNFVCSLHFTMTMTANVTR
ncbi:MAG: plastocyanin/azurin family copper-binding protein, partial [Solirubrobacterales bacterium]